MRGLVLAANNGSIGGGEVMLLQMAATARSLGADVRVVGPDHPVELVQAARSAGFPTSGLPSRSRADYMRSLRRWNRGRQGEILWCHGLVPSMATSNQPLRVVHLHQLPRGWHQAAARLARLRSLAVVVPSRFMAQAIPGSQALANWTPDIRPVPQVEGRQPLPCRLGFVGRLSQDKGVDVLARAVGHLLERDPGSVELKVAGDTRFVPPPQVREVRKALAEVDGDVTELGWVDPLDFFASIDVAVFPSTWDEPFGLVVAEAMAAGVPFVVSDAGALPEVAGENHPWVARAGDSQDLARVIRAAWTAVRSGTAPTAAARTRWELEYSPTAGSERLATMLTTLGVLA